MFPPIDQAAAFARDLRALLDEVGLALEQRRLRP